MDDLQRELFTVAERIGRNACCTLVTLVTLDLAALWLGYKGLSGSLDGNWWPAALVLIPLSIAATVWFLLRVAASIGTGGGGF